jgi:hypothetical protein
MTPLDILKYIVATLEGSPFEFWVNLLLFLLFVAAVYKVTILILSKDGSQTIKRLAMLGVDKLNQSTEYAPGAEAIRKKVWPYVNLLGSLYMSLISFLSFCILALVYIIATRSSVPVKVHVLTIILLIGSLIYSKTSIAQVTWTWHEIKQRKANKRFHSRPG